LYYKKIKVIGTDGLFQHMPDKTKYTWQGWTSFHLRRRKTGVVV